MGLTLRTGLRTRITVSLVAIALLTAMATAIVVTLSARAFMLQTQQEAYFDDFRDASSSLSSRLTSHPDVLELQGQTGLISTPNRAINLHTGESAGSLRPEQIPSSVHQLVEDGEGPIAYLRTTVDDKPVFIVGQWLGRDGPGDPASDPIGFFVSYPLDDEYEQVNRLLLLALGAGLASGAVAALIGLLLGRAIGRPLRSLAVEAARIGEGRSAEVVRSGDVEIAAIGEALHRSSARLDATIEELRLKEADSRRLVADVSHELRTPLASMIAVGEVLEDEDSPEADRRRAAAILMRSTRHIARLATDILEMSRLDAGASTPLPEDVELTALLRTLVRDRDWSASVELCAPETLIVSTDRARITLIAVNLISNAMRHGAAPVIVGLSVADDTVVLTVTDHGIGVDPLHESRIFERFYKAAPDRARSESSGLGLAIAHENALLLGGSLTYRREVDRTVFDLRLPLHDGAGQAPA